MKNFGRISGRSNIQSYLQYLGKADRPSKVTVYAVDANDYGKTIVFKICNNILHQKCSFKKCTLRQIQFLQVWSESLQRCVHIYYMKKTHFQMKIAQHDQLHTIFAEKGFSHAQKANSSR